MDFSSGDWALVGVPVHNYRMMPIQEELGTFVTKDVKPISRDSARTGI